MMITWEQHWSQDWPRQCISHIPQGAGTPCCSQRSSRQQGKIGYVPDYSKLQPPWGYMMTPCVQTPMGACHVTLFFRDDLLLLALYSNQLGKNSTKFLKGGPTGS